MSKNVNKTQSELLLNKMLGNKEIACGFVRQNKYNVAAFWSELNVALNSAGPPTKSVFEWKKVWGDQKRYVRKKAAQNLLHSRGTGGGPNRQQLLTASEEAIFQLIGAKEAVEGVEGGSVFGTSSESNSVVDLSDLMHECLTEVPACSETPTHTKRPIDDVTTSINRTPYSKRSKMSTSACVEKELENQNTLCMTISDGVSCTKTHNAEMEVSIKRVYRALEKHNDIKKEALGEQKRHNLAVEKLKKEKIEINLRLIELEELKLSVGR